MHEKVRQIAIDDSAHGQRIDNFLLRELKGVPRSHVYKLLRRGEVRVNKGRAKPTRRLSRGDVVRIPPLRMAVRAGQGTVPRALLDRIDKAILYEDKRLLFIDKPSGIAVHGGSGISFGIIEILRALRPEQSYLELAHRLDRDTSGCLMLAKRRSALRTLQGLQMDAAVDKDYLALLSGRWQRDSQRVRAPLQKNMLKSGERLVRVDAAGKSAETRFRVRSRHADSMLVEARLGTGRTHQIRVHAAWLGTPILGDDKYGDDQANSRYRDLGLRRLFLHARRLRFDWPGNAGHYCVTSPLPRDLQHLLENMPK